ncbi:SemiSWEET transporter [Rhodohalobacter sulfatireducens]|uniref:SemiSWEET transporter n=1 Tax=Rhodohalobacter sulfatireducens TaxID=2911366 RepID=A0ABS9KCK6_9BACT|nr:SemiSWEET transporter [Rhodohalobacter sulfatireducens]MCG2588589.1 SemiSWEET transporter [Rhodohalobacter sulfatireducens]MDR9363868.1 SemiSWEET transporter [Balneolaceae bacterium]MDR9407237.1 SemiSWEET transporter [Balneolaceae bacterium]
MDYHTIIGLAAGFCTTIAFLPQALKTWKTKSAKDLSLSMYSVFCTGIVLWLTYGIMIQDMPIILTNVVSMILASSILYFKLSFKE